MPLEVLVRFGRWDDILAEPTHPPSEDRIARLTEMAAGIQHSRKAPVGLPAQV